MKTLVLFFMVFSHSYPHEGAYEQPLIMHFDMPAAECEQAVLDSPHRDYHGPVDIPGYSVISKVWCEDKWPATMDAEVKARE